VSRTQRLVFLGIAVVIAVVAVVAFAAGGGDDEKEAASTPTATATPAPDETETPADTPTETPTATPTPRPIPTLRAGRERTLTFKKGDTVRFRAVHSEPEEVHVHGYDIAANVAPGKPARFSFRADITGIFEIELEHSHTHIGRLRVNP
jgi:hypothetical protein